MSPDYNRAAEMAYKSIISLNIRSLPIDPLRILQICKNTSIHTYDDIMPRFNVSDPHYFKTIVLEQKDAFTIRRDFGSRVAYELFYDSHANRLRMRFTLAHELGHIVLKHRKDETWEEREADYFAAQLLAPRPVFNVLALHGFNTANPELLANVFSLSNAAAEIAAKAPRHQPDIALYRDVYAQFVEYVESIQR